jgi:hypothetical protein
VARGVEERLATTVHAYPGLHCDPIPAQFLRLPAAAVAAGGQRILRGGRLPDVADDVFEAVAELWEHAGCRVQDTAGLDGRLLVVHFPDGYLLTLARHDTDDPILTVASPPTPTPYLDPGLLGGLAAGLGVGCLGPCVSSVAPSAVSPALAGVHAAFWAWIPLFLLVSAVCLYLPETRRFGVGLLIGGGLVGLSVATIFAG